jgi:hypothetical protein
MENTFAGGLIRMPYPAIVYDIKRAFCFSEGVYPDGNKRSVDNDCLLLFGDDIHAFSAKSGWLDNVEIFPVRVY